MSATRIRIECNRIQLTGQARREEEGITQIDCTFAPDEAASASLSGLPAGELSPEDIFVHIILTGDGAGACGIWHPDSGFQKNMKGDWAGGRLVSLSHSAPVITLFDADDRNLFTYAVSEVSRESLFFGGVHEETGEFIVHSLILLTEAFVRSQDGYRLSVRLDERGVLFSEALGDVSRWWDALLPDPPMHVPDCARLPMYSTWYNFHQDLDETALGEEYRLSSAMGMRAVIIDDGWETSDVNRGYAYSGDWEVSREKFRDFPAHVRRIHENGMKCIVWFSVPFVGECSRSWGRFQDQLLHYDPVQRCGILDPRYREVREYLIGIYTGAARSWGIDGFKLDFIDCFRTYEDTPPCQPQMDYMEIQEAVYALMLEIRRQVGCLIPDPLIEFRQTYIGPQMRRFGNFLRVGDCPMSGVSNRVGTTDLRLLSAGTAVHCDMLMWQSKETPEDVAIQMLNSIFSTYQISVRVSELEDRVRRTLEHYLDFSVRYRKILQEGAFRAFSPTLNYPVLQSSDETACITARYDRSVILSQEQTNAAPLWWILNGCRGDSVPVLMETQGRYAVRSFDCTGEQASREERYLTAGAHTFSVPAGGSLCLQALP